MDVIVGFLVGWAAQKAQRVGQRINDHTDQTLDSLVERVWALLVAKLGMNPWLNRLRAEATQSGAASPEVRSQTQRILQDAADHDPQFAHDLRAAVQAAMNHAAQHPAPPAHNTGTYIGSIIASGRVSIRQKIINYARRRPLPFTAVVLVLAVLLAWSGYEIFGGTQDSPNASTGSPVPSQARETPGPHAVAPGEVCNAISTSEAERLGLPGQGERADTAGLAICRWPTTDFDMDITIAPDTPVDGQQFGQGNRQQVTLAGHQVIRAEAEQGVICGYLFPYRGAGSAIIRIDFRTSGQDHHPCDAIKGFAEVALPRLYSTDSPAEPAGSDFTSRLTLITGGSANLDNGDTNDITYDRSVGLLTQNGALLALASSSRPPSRDACTALPSNSWRTTIAVSDLRTGMRFCIKTGAGQRGAITLSQFGDPGNEPISIEIEWVIWH